MKLQKWRELLVEEYLGNSPKGQFEPEEGWLYLIPEAEIGKAFGRIMEAVELLGIEGKKGEAFRKTLSRSFWSMGGEERESIHVDTLAKVREVAPIRTTFHQND